MNARRAGASVDATNPNGQTAEPQDAPVPDWRSILASISALEQDVRATQIQLRQLATRLDHHLAGLAQHRALVTSLLPTMVSDHPTVDPTVSEGGLRIHCFGQFQVFLGNRPVLVQHNGATSGLLKYLAAHLGKPVQRDVLLAALWPEVNPDTANNRLKGAIHRLRQWLSDLEDQHGHKQCVVFSNGCYLLDPKADIWVDVDIFESEWLAGMRLEGTGQPSEAMPCYMRAEALYTGDFLRDDLCVEWTLVRREHLKDTHLTILDKLSRHWLHAGHLDQAVEGWKKILACDPWREDAYRHLMACLAESGNRGLALRWYAHCLQVLREQIGIEPEPATIELHGRIRAGKDVSQWLVA